MGQAACPRTDICAWSPHRYSLLDPDRTAVPWLFGCPGASEWASQGSESITITLIEQGVRITYDIRFNVQRQKDKHDHKSSRL